jgi:hypothetical protein
VIGRVAGLDVGWFDRRPLFGRTVVVTRARHQAPELVRRLEAAGAEVLVVPTIAVAGPSDGGAALDRAAAHLGRYSWVVFTSTNAVDRFLPLLRDARAFGTARVAAIGPGTADALARFGVLADLVPSRSNAEGLLEVFPSCRGPPWPATCSPTACGPAGGRWRSWRRTARSRSRRPGASSPRSPPPTPWRSRQVRR